MPSVEMKPTMFCWCDLMTPDVESAKKFYGSLFGWNHEDKPAGEYGFYTMFSKGDVDVAGMGAQPPEREGMPPVWNSYVLVEDADAATARASELGGTVLMPVMDVMDAGCMSVIQDPTGAVVSLWQPKEHEGATVFNEHGALTWNELATRDPDKARSFYGDLLGWTWEEMDLGEMGTYYVCKVGDRGNGGVITMNDQWPAEVPAHWMVYLGCDDVDGGAAKVTELGGKVCVPPTDIAVGRFAVVSDPQGGTFTLFRGNEETDME